MVSLLVTISAILSTNYSQLLNIQFFYPLTSLYVYTNPDSYSSIVPCSYENHWTLFFDHEVNCSALLTLDPIIDLDSYPHLILGIQSVDEYFLIPQRQSVCMNILNDDLVLHIGRMTKGKEEIENCYPYVHLNHPLQFDSFLLMDWETLLPVLETIDPVTNWPIMCASIEYSFLPLSQESSQSIPRTTPMDFLTIISSFNSNLDSFFFWLEFCNLESLVTRIYQQSKQTNVSECLMNRVEGLPSDSHFDHTLSLICIEDLFPLLSSSSSSSIETTHFISPIGLETLLLKNSNSSLLKKHISDLNSMIFAFQNLERSPSSSSSLLVVRSALKGFVKYLIQGTSPTLINEILLTLSTTTDLFQWRQSFSYFTFHLKDWFGSWVGDITDHRRAGTGDRLSELINRYLFIQYFDELLGQEAITGSVTSPKKFQQQEQQEEEQAPQTVMSFDLFSRYLMGETLNRYISYLTLDSPALPSSPLLSPSSLPSPSQSYLYHLGRHFMIQQSQTEAQQAQMASEECQSHEIISYELSSFSVVSTTTHVLIFVTPGKELDDARNLLQKWRSECQYCVLVIQYLIFVIPNAVSLDVMASSSRSSSGSSSSSQHQYRQILLTLNDYLVHLVVDPDLVTVLIGFNSMKSFIQPSDSAGLLPLPVIGGVSFVRLFASLVFASQHYYPPPRSSSDVNAKTDADAADASDSKIILCSEVNLNAFVGTSHQVLHFVNQILHPSSSSSLRGSSDSSLRFLASQYLSQYKDSHDIRIDSHFQFFDFRPAANANFSPSTSDATEQLTSFDSSSFDVTPNPSLLKLPQSDYLSTIERAHETITSATNFDVCPLTSLPSPRCSHFSLGLIRRQSMRLHQTNTNLKIISTDLLSCSFLRNKT
jgi:hypothetical protein